MAELVMSVVILGSTGAFLYISPEVRALVRRIFGS